MAYQPPETPNNEQQRLQSLLDTGLLGSAAEERFDRITRLAQQLLQTPIALVSLVDKNRQWFKSKQGLDADETSRDISFCGHAILSDEIFEISDASLDQRFAENPLVTGGPLIRFYAGAPLHAKNGYRIGTLCIIDDKPRQLDPQQRASLRDLADCVEAEIHKNRLEELDNIIEGTRVGTWEWNVQTGETVFNERWAEIIGYTLEELAPISIETWSKLVHPDDGELSGQLLEKCFSKELDYYDCKARMRHKDGHWVWVHDRGKVSAWTDDNKPLIMSGTHADINEMMEAMESAKSANTWLNAVMDSANFAIVTANNDEGIIHNFNKCAEELLGYHAEDLIGKQSPAIFHDLDEVVDRAKVLSAELGQEIEPGFEVFVIKTRMG
ncbi:MAG: PAS domain S-box protein, partial [Pseudomonadales bacterium]|nr:PAS domain S-box protein [Pseudomonadales bacterium]